MEQITKTPIVQAMDELVYTGADEVKAVNNKQLERVLNLEAIVVAKEALEAREAETLHGEKSSYTSTCRMRSSHL